MAKTILPFLRQNELALVTLALGLLTLVHSLDYEIGTLEQMGPGYYPMLLGVALCLLGGLKLIAGLRSASAPTRDARIGGGVVRFWIALLGGMLAFIVLGAYAGFLPATFVSILAATFGTANMTNKDRFVYSVVATVLIIAVFKYGLNIQFPLIVMP